jgi:hypothetical protein
MRTIPIIVMVRPDGIDVNPTYVNVPNDSKQDVRLRWTAVGATFRTTDCFEWKNNPPGAPAVPCTGSSGTNVLESAAYRNDDSSQRVWQYSITVEVDGTPVTIDPEVNNEPPTP